MQNVAKRETEEGPDHRKYWTLSLFGSLIWVGFATISRGQATNGHSSQKKTKCHRLDKSTQSFGKPQVHRLVTSPTQPVLNGPPTGFTKWTVQSVEIVVFDLAAFVSFALMLCSGENLKRGCSLWREKHQFYGPHPPREQLFKLF